MKSAFIIQRPDKIFIHTDTPDLTGKHWQQLLDIPSFKDVLVIKKVEAPSQVFGVDLFWNHHKADVLRYEIFFKKFHSFVKDYYLFGSDRSPRSHNLRLSVRSFVRFKLVYSLYSPSF